MTDDAQVERTGMHAHKLYVSLLVADLDAATDWYSRLLGREPDNRPMDWMVQWEMFDAVGLALATGDTVAAHGAFFLYVDDIDAERARLSDVGVTLGADIAGDYSTLAQVHDPDGNLITLATPPKRPFPGA